MKRTYKNTRKYSGMRMLSASLNNVTSPIFKRRGFAENKIITDWNFIVGKELGNSSTPKKIAFNRDKKSDGVLTVEIYDSGTAMEMTYMEPVLIEKISAYFGYKAVARLKIIQRPGGQPDIGEEKKIKIRKLSDEKSKVLNGYLDDIDDLELKDALASLGAGVMSDN
jgi:hypothetical protein